MLYKDISKILGNYLFYFALILCLPLAVAIYFEYIADSASHPQPHTSLEFLETILICIACALFLRFLGRKASGVLYRRESIILAVLIWLVSALIGSLPFYLSKTLSNPVDAYFEAISGFTTTGATMIAPKAYNDEGKEIPIKVENYHVPGKVYYYYGTISPVRGADGKVLFSGVEAVSKALLFWRSFMQWLGGMGIVVFFLSVLPALGVGGKFLYQMEMTGPVKDSIAPRISQTASLLWKLYLSLSIIQVLLLIWTNNEMPLLDAICVTFSTLSTGGYSIKNNSIASYGNPHTEWIVLLFMIVGSINFALYFHILRGKFYRIYVPDFFLFIGIIIAGAALVGGYLIYDPSEGMKHAHESYTNWEAMREGAFQSVSAQTSTGFTTQNYDVWPFASQMFMLILMFVGGMSGATSGGIKTPRFYLLYKIITHKIELIFRPETVRKLTYAHHEVDSATAITVLVFFCIAAISTLTGTVIYILDGIDPESSLGLMGCMLNNIGMAFRAAGPDGSFLIMSNLSKLMSCFWMLIGRLEFFAIILLFIPAFWRGR